METPPDLSVTLIQTALHWEDREANLAHFSRLIDGLHAPGDLIVLPEMFTTGFSMKPNGLAEPVNGKALQWMKKTAQEKNAVLTGSVIVEERGKFFNRLYWVTPQGEVLHYNKRHLFRMAGEHEQYSSETEMITPVLKGWRIRPLVCYDLRFPVWSRNRWTRSAEGLRADYDVLLYVANWPERRRHPWRSLLVARAIENQAYVAGLNRVGEDGNGISHSGDSALIDFKGETIAAAGEGKEAIVPGIFSYGDLEEFRKVFPVGMDADEFEIK